MRLSLILGVCIVSCGTLVANAYHIPVAMYGGNVSVGCERLTPGQVNRFGYTIPDGYDEVDFYLNVMYANAAGLATDGSQVRINIIEGRWTTIGGQFWVNSNLTSRKTKTTSSNFGVPTYSCVNFDSNVGGATIWTNLGGGGGAGSFTGNLTPFFSGSWYTTDYNADLVIGQGGPNPTGTSGPFYGPNPDYSGAGYDSTYLAALFVTHATPDIGIGFGAFPGSGGSGKMSFTYYGGTVENVAFMTIPEPGALSLLLTSVAGFAAYIWRWRRF